MLVDLNTTDYTNVTSDFYMIQPDVEPTEKQIKASDTCFKSSGLNL